MNTEEQARELMAKQRQHGEHLHDNLLSRAEHHQNPSALDETARENIVQQRQQNNQIQENMLERSVEQLQG